MAEEVLNPLTGLPVGGSADIKEIDPKTDKKVAINPLTGQEMGSIQTPQRSYIGGSRRQAASLSDAMMNSQHSVKLGEDIRNFTKYGVPLGQDLDWQELRARNQSTAEQWGNGLAKAGVTALGAVAENTLGVVFGLGELATGGSYYDNAIGKSIDSTNEWMRENMPNYLTAEEQKMSTISKLGTANFWADTVANGLGYSLGSIATMWMTGGGGLLTKGIAGAAKGLGIYNASKAVINGTKLAAKLGKSANLGTTVMRASQMLEAGAMMSLAEASVEARETQKTVYDDLVQAHLEENNLDSINDIDAATLQELNDISYSAGNTNFVSQLPVLMGTNVLMFGKQIAGFKGASKASSDVAFDQVKKKAVSKLADKSVWRQTLDRMKPTAMNALEEASQEGFQFASGVFAHSYHTDKYNDGGYGDMAKSLNKALSETFGTQEGLESMFVGALTGGLMGSAQSTIGKEYSTRKTSAAALAKFINGGYLNNAEQKLLNASASASVMKQMQVHLEKGDIKKFKDAQFKLIEYQAYEALQRGGMDVYLEKLEDAKNLDADQFMEAFGFQTKDPAGNAITLEQQTDGDSQAKVVDDLKAKVENFRKVYDNVNERFPLADKTSGLPRMLMSEENRKAEDAAYKDQENLRAQLIFSGAEIGNRSQRMTDIQKNMGDTLSNSISPKKAKLKADLDALLADQDPNSAGEIDPAKDFDAGDQYQKIEDGLQEIRNELLKEDGDANASDKFFKDAVDYVTLAQENKQALDSYNKLSSDEYFQEQFKREVEVAQKAAKQAQTDKKGREVLKNAKSSQELGENMPDGLSAEVQEEYDKKYKEFKDAENEAVKKFLESDLDTLYGMDKSKMSSIEVEALKDAIDILEKRKSKAPTSTKKFGFESESTASITEDGVSITPNPEYQQKQQDLEEAFRPENVGGVQAVGINGREFQIDGELHYNVNPNPLDAIIRDKNGNITGVQLRDELGSHISIYSPENKVDAIAYSILMSEQLKSEGYQELSKDEIFEKLTTFNEEVAEEISTKGDRGKHGSKTTELLREEIYSLERARDEALETYDYLRTYYMQELNATKTELKNDKDLKDLNRKINSIRAQIGARNKILRLRGEAVTATDSEVLKIERKAMKKIENFEQDLASAQNEIQEAQQEIESLQEDVDRFKAADDFDSYRAALADRKAAEALLAEAEKSVKNLKRKINYHKNKLKRLANEKSKQPAGDAEQAAPGTAEKAQEQVDEREDTDSGAVPKETQTNVKPVRYKIKDKTATYTVKYENNEYVVYNSKGNPVNWKEGQQKHKNRIVGKHLVQEGKAVVVEHNGKKFIVTPKYLSPSNTPFIIQEDGKRVSRAGLATQQLADVFDAIMRKAAAKFRAMVADTTETPTDKSTEKNVIEEKGRQNLKKEVDNKQTQPGTPKSDKLTVVAEYEMSDLIDDDTASSGPVGNIADLAPPSNKDNLGIKDGAEFKRLYTMEVSTPQGEQQAVDFMIRDVNKAGMDWKIGNKATVDGRDVIEIVMPNGYSFLMYKSTGTGSSAQSKNLWVPIPGFANDKIGRFIKVYDTTNGKSASQKIDPKFTKYEVPLFQSIANTLESLANEKVDPMSLEKGWSPKSKPAAKKESVKSNKLTSQQEKEFTDFNLLFAELYEGRPVSGPVFTENSNTVFSLIVLKNGKLFKNPGSQFEQELTQTEVNAYFNLIKTANPIFKEVESIVNSIVKDQKSDKTYAFWQKVTKLIQKESLEKTGKRVVGPELINAVNQKIQSLEGTKRAKDILVETVRERRESGQGATTYDRRFMFYKPIISLLSQSVNISAENLSEDKFPTTTKYIMQELAAEKESVSPNQAINIYAGTKENAELSNFAERPFMYGNTQFNTVEGAFQAIKANDYADKDSKKNQDILDKLETATGAEAKRLGRQIEGLNTSVWDKDSPAIMKDLIKKSFEANPSARKALLATGNATLTHTQDKSKWGKLFPKILMEVRDELRQANVKPAAPTMSGSGTQLTAVAAREDKVEVVDELNYKGDVQIKSRVVVSDTGAPDTFDADTIDGEPILLNKEKLVDPNLMGKDVTFEIIENDYYKNNPSVAVPIYYKIDGELVGKLEANSPNRDVLEQRLKDGEQVTMQVSEVIAGNFNHSRTMDGSSFFSDPREQFRDPLLAFVEVVENIPAWTLSQVSSNKNKEGDVPQIKSDIVGTGTEKINYGQVGIIVRPENSPGGQARISMASTANLSPKAQDVTYQALINEDFEKAKTIVANSLFETQLGASQSEYMQFGAFKAGANFVVFQSPELGELVRITEENLKSAGQNKPFKYNIVEVSSDENGTQFFKNTNRNIADYNPAADLKEFLKLKKYHVSRDLGNVSTSYTSPVTGNEYNTYQDYLFSAEEIGTDRKVGKGHHSILTTDVVMLNGSMFHNPKITFSEDASNIKSAKDVIQSDSTAPGSAEQTQQQKSDLLNELSDMGGLNFGDQIKKDELDQDCIF